jgi:ATP-dependent DNA ligase
VDIKPSVALDLLAVEVERITPADPAVAQNGARLELTTPKKPRMLSKHKHVVAPTHASVIQRRSRQHATALPTWVEPQLTMLVDRPPDGLHEIKFDGYRMPGCSRRRIG